VKQLLQRETTDFITADLWPPNSPDLNTADYRICGVMQQRLYRKSNWMQMNWSGFWLKRVLASSKVLLIRQLTNWWQVLLNAYVKAKGKHFENMLWSAVPWMSIICYVTSVIFCFTTFNQSWLSFSSGCWTIFGMFIEFRTVKKYLVSKCEIFIPFCYKYIQVTACKKFPY